MNLKRRILKAALATLAAIAVNAILDAPRAYASDSATLTKTQTFMESEGESSVKWPETMRNEEGAWRLVSISAPTVDTNWIRPSELKTVTKNLTVPANHAQAANDLFENTVDYNESGWTGTLTKAGVSLLPEYEVCTRQVDRLITLEGFAANDVTQIPQTKEFEISTAESLNSTGTASLTLSDVAWLVTKTDEQGIPVEYSASCNYRGTEEYLTIPSYTLTCTWTGEAQQADTQMISTATYELEEPFPWAIVIVGIVAASCITAFAYARTRLSKRKATP